MVDETRSNAYKNRQGRNYQENTVNKETADGDGYRYELYNSDDDSNSKIKDERPDVKFTNVGGSSENEDEDEEDEGPAVLIAFKYKQPSVSVSTQANFAEHDVFGDVTVRQKLGEKPDEISVNGICTAEEANDVDNLVYQEVVELVSNRWSGVVHVASTSTDPISEGGGQDLQSNWIYSFTIECVEITESIDKSEFSDEELLNIDGEEIIDIDGDGELDDFE